MMKITNGIVTREVTKGMFDGMYSRMGFKPVEEVKKSVIEIAKNKEEVNTRKEEVKEQPIKVAPKASK